MSYRITIPDVDFSSAGYAYGVILSPGRYWMLEVGGTADSVNGLLSAESIELRETPGGPDVTTPAMVVTSTSENTPNSFITYAFDNVPGEYNSGVPTVYPVQIIVDLGANNAKNIQEIFWQPWSLATNRAPTSLTVKYSMDKVTWVTAWAVTGIVDWTSLGKKFTRPT